MESGKRKAKNQCNSFVIELKYKLIICIQLNVIEIECYTILKCCVLNVN